MSVVGQHPVKAYSINIPRRLSLLKSWVSNAVTQIVYSYDAIHTCRCSHEHAVCTTTVVPLL